MPVQLGGRKTRWPWRAGGREAEERGLGGVSGRWPSSINPCHTDKKPSRRKWEVRSFFYSRLHRLSTGAPKKNPAGVHRKRTDTADSPPVLGVFTLCARGRETETSICSQDSTTKWNVSGEKITACNPHSDSLWHNRWGWIGDDGAAGCPARPTRSNFEWFFFCIFSDIPSEDDDVFLQLHPSAEIFLLF